MQYEWVVLAEEQGKTLQQFLAEHLVASDYSLRKIKGFIDAGYCRVQGRPERFYRTKVSIHSRIQLTIPEVARKKELELLFEDEEILIYNKPAGLSCDERLVSGRRAFLVHRLDKETTGCLIMAKSARVKERLIEQFREKAVQKVYLAICDRTMEQDSGVVENFLAEIGRIEGKVHWGERPTGLYAKTTWRSLARGQNCSLVELLPETGRTHQLRVHMSSIGHPILGDFQYGKNFSCSYTATRHLLHARSITFSHPITHEKIHVLAPLPDDMQKALRELFGALSCAF